MASITAYIEGKLQLRVNREKSAVAPVWERKYLGHRLLSGGRLGIAPQSVDRMQERVRQITRRNRGVSLERVIEELNAFLTGWVTYYRYAECKSELERLDEWIRRKLRCLRLKQRKRAKPIADFLQSLGVPARRAWLLALSGKGWWRKAGSPQAQEAMTGMVRGTRTNQSVRQTRDVKTLKETAGYAKYVRWCGRTGAVRPPPTRF